MMMSNTQFIENRVYDEDEGDEDEGEGESKSGDSSSNDTISSNPINDVKQAFQSGFEAMKYYYNDDSQANKIDVRHFRDW